MNTDEQVKQIQLSIDRARKLIVKIQSRDSLGTSNAHDLETLDIMLKLAHSECGQLIRRLSNAGVVSSI